MVGPGVGEGHGQGLDQVGFGGSCGKEFEFYLQGNGWHGDGKKRLV